MIISQKDWLDYIGKLEKVNQSAAAAMQRYIDQAGYTLTPELMEYAYQLTTIYGEASAELACQMYDAVAMAQDADVMAAEPGEPSTYEELVAELKKSYQHSQFETPAVVARRVKLAASDTTLKNAIRDKAQFAWIPSYDGCPFCRTIASRGWRQAGKKTLSGNHADHIHKNCRCEYAIRFNDKLNVAGYDPDKLLAEYQQADGGRWDEKINSMRRDHYAAHKDEINAQKRAAYKRLMDSRQDEK